jgi:hypothetical protein
LKRLRASKEYQSGDRTAVNRMRLLSAIAARGQNAETASASKGTGAAKRASAPSQSQKLEARIKELRTHVAYADGSHPSHKEVAARVTALYEQLSRP